MWWLTYVWVPLLGGVLAVLEPTLAKRADTRLRKLALLERGIGVALLFCGVRNGFEAIRMVFELNGTGIGLFHLILISQLGLGGRFAFGLGATHATSAIGKAAVCHEKSGRLTVVLGCVVLFTVLAMLCVRGQSLAIFG
jgi:hypothetical protein